MILLNNIHVEYQSKTAVSKKVLSNIHLEVKPGEFVTIVGGNGAGKSTLMKLLSGEIFPTQGDIVLNQQNITKWSACKRSAHIARLFQDPLLGTFSQLTILENLSLAAKRGQKRNLGLYLKRGIRSRCKELLKPLDLGLENKLDLKVECLSGGQRQVLSLIMATLQQAKLLLLDEHTAALDPKTAKEIMDLTCVIVAKNKITTLMITHSLAQALSVGNRTIVLNEGTVIDDLHGTRRSNMQTEDLLRYFL